MQNKPKPSPLEWLEITLLIAPFLYLAAQWGKFPALVPIHWNIHGKIDGWAPKSWGLPLLPLTTAGMWCLLKFLPMIDPKVRRSEGEERQRAMAVFGILRPALLLFFTLTFCVQIANTLGLPLPMDAFALNACLVLLIVIGNFSAKIRPNYFTGIRTPWTLENPETWRATHRIGGRIMVFGALALLVTEFFVSRQIFNYLFVAFIMGFAAWALLYSWNHARTHPVGMANRV